MLELKMIIIGSVIAVNDNITDFIVHNVYSMLCDDNTLIVYTHIVYIIL